MSSIPSEKLTFIEMDYKELNEIDKKLDKDIIFLRKIPSNRIDDIGKSLGEKGYSFSSNKKDGASSEDYFGILYKNGIFTEKPSIRNDDTFVSIVGDLKGNEVEEDLNDRNLETNLWYQTGVHKLQQKNERVEIQMAEYEDTTAIQTNNRESTPIDTRITDITGSIKKDKTEVTKIIPYVKPEDWDYEK